jgi:RND family efflux transporter MFP subunit
VTYAEVTRGTIEQAVETTGIFQPMETTVARGSVAGIVENVAVRPGDRVDRGDIVAVLDRDVLVRSVEEARRNVEDAELAEALARERASSGSDADVADALLAAGRAETARALLAEAETAVEATILIAPISGIVLDVPIAIGAPYVAGSSAAIIAGDAVQIAATLDQADLPIVGLGARVRVVPDALPDLELTGSIDEIAPRGDQDGGTARFGVVVRLNEPSNLDARLRVGMTARLIVPSVVVSDAILVPAEAIETVGRRTFVRVSRNGEDETVEVSLGLRQGGLVQVAAGDLAVGDRVRLSS